MLVIIIYQIYAQMTGLKLINKGHPQGRGIEDSRKTSMRSPTTCETKSLPYKKFFIFFCKIIKINHLYLKYFYL